MNNQPYRVLARKYRPKDFSSLIGQDFLVQTLTNAIRQDRIAQAFMLTGVRGVGKTTTARIIAKALNCIGADGQQDATPEPCGQCANCVAIAEDHHVDVKEIDAASHNGVDQVRDIVENIHYRPVQARYSIIILDEVHMLSTSAFNAILKTLEEPPAHAKFIFATTEIRKVPVTVLSRCQRFDLRRVPMASLVEHYQSIAQQEGLSFDEEAISLIARAADGSVRDGLSLLDQAIILAGTHIETAAVRDMLGLADRSQLWVLYHAILEGKIDDALPLLEDLHAKGGDAIHIVQDLLDITHFLSRVKMSSWMLDAPETPEIEKQEAAKIIEKLTLAALTRLWQGLLKGLEEIKQAPNPYQALEMLIIRLIHMHDMPPLGPMIKRLEQFMDNKQILTGEQNSDVAASPAPVNRLNGSGYKRAAMGGGYQIATGQPQIDPTNQQQEILNQFQALSDLLEQNGDEDAAIFMRTQIKPTGYQQGRLQFATILPPRAEQITGLAARLEEITGEKWIINLEKAQNQAQSIMENKESVEQSHLQEAQNSLPFLKDFFSVFQGAILEKIHQQTPTDLEPQEDAYHWDDLNNMDAILNDKDDERRG